MEAEDLLERMRLLKLSLQGEVLRDLQLPAEGSVEHRAIASAPNGDLIMVGDASETLSDDPTAISAHRVTEDGEILWSQRYGGGITISAQSIVLHESGNLAFIGYVGVAEHDTDMLVLNTNADGEESSRWFYNSANLNL